MTSDAEDGPDSLDHSHSESPAVEDRESGSDQEGAEMAEHPEIKSEGAATKSSSAKDPLRPRRKKARRACFACQRAHLTCGMFMSGCFDMSSLLLPAPPTSPLTPVMMMVHCKRSGLTRVFCSQEMNARVNAVSSVDSKLHARTAFGKRPSIFTMLQPKR